MTQGPLLEFVLFLNRAVSVSIEPHKARGELDLLGP